MFRDVKAVHSSNFITQPPCQTGNVGSCGSAVRELVLEVIHLCFGYAVLEHTVKIVVRAVVVGGVGTKVALSVYIPLGKVRIGVKTIPDVAGGNFLVAHHSAVP